MSLRPTALTACILAVLKTVMQYPIQSTLINGTQGIHFSVKSINTTLSAVAARMKSRGNIT